MKNTSFHILEWGSTFVICILLAYIGFAMLWSHNNLSTGGDMKTLVSESWGSKIDLPEAYSPKVLQRNIFLPSNQSASTPTVSIKALPAYLKIVGVFIGKPSEVMIENQQLKQTVFISQGETKDGLKIERIEIDRVLVSFQGQRIEVVLKR